MSRSAWHRTRSGFGSLLIASYCFAAPLQAAGPGTATYSYDDLGRLRTGDFSDGRKVDYQYDAAGNRTSVVSGSPPVLTVAAPASVSEGSSLSFPISMTRIDPLAANITVSCVPQNGTAQGGGAAPFDDFVTTAQQVTFLTSDPSGTVKNCLIATKTDSYYEGTQVVTAVLQNATGGAAIASPGSAAGSILDANAGPVFSVASSSAAEGSGLGFTITKSGLTELSHNVSYATANGTASTADSDYTSIGTTAATFTSGQTSAPVTVATTSDSKFENAETVALNLSNATGGATIGTSSASGTINNDDAAPSIVINNVSGSEGALLTFTIQNSGNTSTAFTHSISWATANNTATAGSDYTANSGTVSFASGETSKTVQVQSLTDGVYEGASTESFFVNLATNASTNGAVISDSQGLGTIADSDNPVPTTPLMQSPGYRQDPDGNFGIDWSNSAGLLSYYVIEEDPNGTFTTFTPYTITGSPPASFKSFNYTQSGTWSYRVKACSASNMCSDYSATATVEVCIGGCN